MLYDYGRKEISSIEQINFKIINVVSIYRVYMLLNAYNAFVFLYSKANF